MIDGPARYLCLCCGGLEPEAAEATRGFLRRAVPEHADACTIQVFSLDGDGGTWSTSTATDRAKVVTGTAAVGKLIITAPRAVPVTVMLKIPYFISVLALVGDAHALPADKEHGLPYIEEVVRGDANGWANALVTWAAARDVLDKAPPASPSWSERVAGFLAAPESEASPPPSISLRFRGSTLREGEHSFKKPDIMPVVGAGTAARLGDDAIVNLVQFDLETVVLILEKHLHVGLSLDTRRTNFRATVPTEPADPPLRHRGLVATLRPSTAALLCYAARPKAGDVVCDFMAGVGTIPLVAATLPARPPVFALGGDVNPLACECAAKNYRSLVDEMGPQGGGRASLLQWDARRLPLRDACLDVAISDLPFGKKHKIKGGNLRHVYGQAFRECARSLRPGGRLVLLAGSSKSVADALQDRYNAGCWSPWTHSPEGEVVEAAEGGGGGSSAGTGWAPRSVNVGGLMCHVFFVERTSQPLPPRPLPASRKERGQEAKAAKTANAAGTGQKKQRRE